MNMKVKIGFFSLIAGIMLFFNGLCPNNLYGEDKVHTVLRGETFYSIARTFGIKAEDLMKYNGISDPGRLLVGQRLKIPGQSGGTNTGTASQAAAANTAPAARPSMYRVVKGDTFYGIARMFSVSVEAIREANSLPANYLLREGDSLRIPGGIASGSAQTGTSSQSAFGIPEARIAGVTQTTPRETVSGTIDTSVRWPIYARELGYMTGKLSGVAITGAKSESVQSLTRGTVISAGPFQGFGKVAIVQVDGGYLYVYGGCESLSVKEGERVGPGTELGKLGIDAVSNKPQLFFMVYRSNAPIDPAKAPRA